MRIIVPGTPKTPVPEYQTTCGSCGCQFAFTERDVRREKIFSLPISKRTVVLVCPQEGCGLEVGVKLP